MTPKKLPSGNYRVQVYSHKDADGKKHYVSFTAPTRAECLRLGAEFQRDKQLSPTDLTVEQAYRRWLDNHKNVYSPKTLYEYEKGLRYFGFLLPIKVSKLTSSDLQKWVSEYSVGRKPITVKTIFGYLMSCLNTYTDRKFHVDLPQRPKKRYDIPTKESFKALLDIAAPSIRLCIILGGLYGLRRGEICGLDASDIDREKKTMHIHCDVVNGPDGWVKKEMPKNSTSDRILPIDDKLLAMLPEKGPIYKYRPNSLTNRFCLYRNKLGLKCRFHDLRHYSATIRSAAGFPVSYNVAFHGWKNDDMLRNVYDNMNEDILQEYNQKSIELISDYLE